MNFDLGRGGEYWWEGERQYTTPDGEVIPKWASDKIRYLESITDLNALGAKAHAIAVAKGFYQEQPFNIVEKLTLIHSEISEALEEVMNGRREMMQDDGKPIGLPIELADAVIRIADLACALGIDLDKAISIKMDYNKERPFLHGRDFKYVE